LEDRVKKIVEEEGRSAMFQWKQSCSMEIIISTVPHPDRIAPIRTINVSEYVGRITREGILEKENDVRSIY
jgi:hypothetical protein